MTWYVSNFYVTITKYLRQLTYKEKKVSLAQDSEDFRLLIEGAHCDESMCWGNQPHSGSQPPVTPVPGIQCLLLAAAGTRHHVVYIHTGMHAFRHTPIHIK